MEIGVFTKNVGFVSENGVMGARGSCNSVRNSKERRDVETEKRRVKTGCL